jgi:hypothetical protein
MKTIRIRTTPGIESGLWVSRTGLSIRRPGQVQSELFTVSYYDRTGHARREFGGPILPGPYAFLTRIVDPDIELSGFETVRVGDRLDIGEDRFVLELDAGAPVLEYVEPVLERGAPDGLELTVVRRKVDGTLGGISRYADTLVLVGLTDSRKLPSRLVTPLSEDCRRVTPSNTSPAVTIDVRSVGSDKPLAVYPVFWNAVDDAYVLDKRGTPGGNFAAWSDARVGDQLRALYPPGFYGALHIHDRSS